MRYFLAITLLFLSCAAPGVVEQVFTPMPTSDNTVVPYSQKPAEVPQDAESATVTASEAVWVRVEADPGAATVGYLHNSDVVSVFPPCVVSDDMGVWVIVRTDELEGYVNARYLSDGVCSLP